MCIRDSTGALTDKTGAFVAANGGTIFLDEIGNLSYEVQIQLLRALQERKILPHRRRHRKNIDWSALDATVIAVEYNSLSALDIDVYTRQAISSGSPSSYRQSSTW